MCQLMRHVLRSFILPLVKSDIVSEAAVDMVNSREKNKVDRLSRPIPGLSVGIIANISTIEGSKHHLYK